MISLLKPVSAAMALFVATLPAQAISRYNAQSMTCGEAQSVVAGEGAAILRYQSERNPSLTLYDRYVAHDGYCRPDEYAKAAWIPTADTNQCPVYACEQRQYDDGIWNR